MTPNDKMAFDLACALLNGETDSAERTEDDLRRVLVQVSDIVSIKGFSFSHETVRRALEQKYIVVFEDADIVISDKVSQTWFNNEDKNKWHHWQRYREWALANRPPLVLKAMDDVTDRIMTIIGNPKSDKPFSRTGIVYGDIQSGKTSNMIALLSKAVAAGYRYCIVLAGMEEELRIQTQLRVDAGLVGASFRRGDKNTLIPEYVGVGKDSNKIYATPITSLEWDLSKTALTPQVGSGSLIFVIKKNPDVLRNLHRLIKSHYKIGKDSNATANDAILIIDDECDWGSLNISKEDSERSEVKPSTINRMIRGVLSSFQRSAYVGYTGTPFANFLISTKEHSEHGKDLFPDDFAIVLPSPSNYMGVARLLGSKGSRLVDVEDRVNHQGIPELIRNISDNEWVKPKHKKSLVPSHHLPESLREAIDRFIITCALRPNEHNSMLVNLTRFQAVQNLIKDRIEVSLSETVNALLCDDKRVWNRLQRLFEDRIKPISDQIAKREPGESPISASWEEVRSGIVDQADGIVVKAIHGTSQDVLQYTAKTPLHVIAIGGQKLSRGITLEGLTISYFDRPANNYDTTLQMGRWFGYRDGYLALCRLYIDEETLNCYKEISDVCETLREDMSMFEGQSTDMALSFKKLASMNITDRSKRQNAVTIKGNYSGRMPEVKIFHTDIDTRQSNILAASNLIDVSGEAIDVHGKNSLKHREGAKLFHNVDRRHVLRFLHEYTTHESAEVVRTENIADFIASGGTMGPDAFRYWNVAFMSANPLESGIQSYLLPNGMKYAPRLRSPDSNSIKNSDGDIDHHRYKDSRNRYVIKRIVTETDESIDIDQALKQNFSAKTSNAENNRVRTNWIAIRAERERTGHNGLLLLYPIVPEIVLPGSTPDRVDWNDRDVPYIGFAMVIPGRRNNIVQVMSKETAEKRNLTYARL